MHQLFQIKSLDGQAEWGKVGNMVIITGWRWWLKQAIPGPGGVVYWENPTRESFLWFPFPGIKGSEWIF